MKTIKGIIFVLFLLVPCICLGSDSDIDPVIQYYLSGVDSAFNRAFIINAASFDCRIVSILNITNYRGETDKIDTAIYHVYFSESEIDSINIIDSAGIDENCLPYNFLPPDIWNQNSEYHFYPNDRGTGRLAIGFDRNDSLFTDIATGFININRNTFEPVSLFIHYPFYKESMRLSKSYFFDYKDGYIRPLLYENKSMEKRFMGQKYIQHILHFDNYNVRKS